MLTVTMTYNNQYNAKKLDPIIIFVVVKTHVYSECTYAKMCRITYLYNTYIKLCHTIKRVAYINL